MLDKIFNMISIYIENKYDKFMSSIEGKQNIVLYGAGGIGNMTYNILKENGCKICYFIDDDKSKWGLDIDGVKIISKNDIKEKNEFIIIICVPCPESVCKRLINENFKNVYSFPIMMASKGFYDTSFLLDECDKICEVYNLLADDRSKEAFINILNHRITMKFDYFSSIISEKQYFPNDLFAFNKNECFVDGGAYDGGTILNFIDEVNNQYNYIYAFEPDEKNFNKLLRNPICINNPKVKLYNAGLYSKTGSVGFCDNGNSSSFISKKGECNVQVIKVDDIIKDCKPTYIKLDIEGSEQEAIYGMKNTIIKYHPKMAISVYHKKDDLWSIPMLIHSIDSSYKLYIRHYLNCLNETVCYAI